MGSVVLLRSLACFLFLLCSSMGAANAMYGTAAADEKASRRVTDGTHGTASAAWPGYLYTRAVGRCTPQFWTRGAEPWPNIVPQDAAVWKVFGSRSVEMYGPRLTLLEATMRTDDVGDSAYVKLVKQGSAALLNAYTRSGFPFDSWEVKALLLEALVSEEAAAVQAERFEQANESCV